MPELHQLPSLAGMVLSLLRSEWWSAERIVDYQERELVKMLRYAVSNVPYYASIGINPKDIQSGRDIRRFPVLTKQDIQTSAELLRNPKLTNQDLNSSTTSGSSGEPTITYFDPRTWLLCKYALKFRRTLLAGTPFGQRLMILSDARVSVDNIPEPRRFRRGIYSELHVSLYAPIEKQLDSLISYRPTMIYGAPSVLQALCDYIAERRIDTPIVRTVFLSSEFISARVRAKIEGTFSGRVIGVYGSTEFKEIAWQCSHGHYHINIESVFVEPGSSANRQDEELLITTLVNRAMPLIRFDIGDYASIKHERCQCGRQSPYLDVILGRRVEYLELPDGRRISPYLLTTNIESLPGLRQYQIVQRRDRSVELRVAFRGESSVANQNIPTLEAIVRKIVGPETPIDVTCVRRIERSPSGKHMIVIHEDYS
jgi:phenylacetate-CoA ligase